MIQYTLKRKKIKSIILKITPSGKIEISAPLRTPLETIEKFLILKKNWVEKKLSLLNGKQALHSPFNDNFIYLLGEKYPLSSLFGEGSDLDKELLKKYFKTQSEIHITPIVEKYLKITGLKIEHLSFKSMKTRWGSCNSRKKYINLNSLLISSPLESIEYIVLHEIAHLKYPHHQREFWEFVTSYLPDWKERRGKLFYFEI